MLAWPRLLAARSLFGLLTPPKAPPFDAGGCWRLACCGAGRVAGCAPLCAGRDALVFPVAGYSRLADCPGQAERCYSLSGEFPRFGQSRDRRRDFSRRIPGGYAIVCSSVRIGAFVALISGLALPIVVGVISGGGALGIIRIISGIHAGRAILNISGSRPGIGVGISVVGRTISLIGTLALEIVCVIVGGWPIVHALVSAGIVSHASGVSAVGFCCCRAPA